MYRFRTSEACNSGIVNTTCLTGKRQWSEKYSHKKNHRGKINSLMAERNKLSGSKMFIFNRASGNMIQHRLEHLTLRHRRQPTTHNTTLHRFSRQSGTSSTSGTLTSPPF